MCHRHGTKEEEYAEDPERGPQSLHHAIFSVTPANSETHAHILKQHFLTPNEALYIRSHAPVPAHLTATSHNVAFSLSKRDGSRDLRTSMSLNELRERFTSTDIISVMQCAGNRQIDDFRKLGANGFTGTPFQAMTSGMVGNVLWRGVRLDALLRSLYPHECREEENHSSVHSDSEGIWHVIFTGADEYESSTPLKLLLQASTDCLLAFEMNGSPLLPDHGYPLRAVLPGLAGARSVKWVEGVTLSRAPCDKPWNAHYYRNYKGEQIQTLPLNSIIFSPGKNDLVQLREDGTGSVSVQGVAYSGGGNDSASIDRVEVTGDGGRTWTSARLLTEERDAVPQAAVGDHSWVRFVAEVPVVVSTDGYGEDTAGQMTVQHQIHLFSRAITSMGQRQPEESPGAEWGQRTYLYAGWGSASLTAVMPATICNPSRS